MPRQTASTGRLRASAARASASSHSSRSGRGGAGGGMTLRAVAVRVDIGAAGEQQAVDAVEHVAGRVGLAGRQQQRDAAGRAHALRVVGRQQVGRLVPHPPRRGSR